MGQDPVLMASPFLENKKKLLSGKGKSTNHFFGAFLGYSFFEQVDDLL